MPTVDPQELLVNKVYTLLAADATIATLLTPSTDIVKEYPRVLPQKPNINIIPGEVTRIDELGSQRRLLIPINVEIYSEINEESTQDYYPLLIAVKNVLRATSNTSLSFSGVTDNARSHGEQVQTIEYDLTEMVRRISYIITYEYKQVK